MSEWSFEFQLSRKLVFGWGESGRLAERVTDRSVERVLFVSDPGVVAAGLLDRVKAPVEAAGCTVAVFSEVEPDPRVETAERAVEAARDADAELIVGVGGGSSLDIAKVAAVLRTNGGHPLDYAGTGLVPKPGLPTILIPTTAGTGSEVTPIAVLSDHQEQLKKGIVSEHLYADVALVDPELTRSVPARVTAYTGMDALTHVIEAYTNRFANAFIDTFALAGIRLMGGSLRKATADGDHRRAREQMALGSLYGGLCLGSVNTGAVHAMAYPLGGMFNVPHGLANSLLLPHVMRRSLIGDLEKYAQVAEALGEPTEGLSLRDAAERSVVAVERLLADVGLPRGLGELDIPADAIPEMAAGAMKVTRLMKNNPRVFTEADCAAVYRAAY